MGILNREQAAVAASRPQRNNPGTCQKWTRNVYGAPSVGDRDRDGDADAVDGWKSEPSSKRHTDREPPRGVPVAWSGGRHGYGHRAISLGNGKIASTDAPYRGHVGIVDLGWVEKNWGLKYLGWSETISGILIPEGPRPSKPKKKSVAVLAKEVIAGKWGNGPDRKARLTKAGYNYSAVQKEVNELLK